MHFASQLARAMETVSYMK